MNKVSIKNHLCCVVNQWLSSINYDLNLNNNNVEDILDKTYYDNSKMLTNIFYLNIQKQYLINLKKSILISGGCITSLLLDEEVNDYDFYFKDINIINSLLFYYLDKFNKHNNTDWKYSTKYKCIYRLLNNNINVENLTFDEFKSNVEIVDAISSKNITDDKKKYDPICITPNAISLTDKIQLIIRFYGEPNEILSNFDYVHTNNYYDYYLNQLILKQEAVESILTKQLIYNGSKYPICSLIRSRKFINRGWFISAGEYLKIAFQINKLDLYNLNVLREQLIGVDAKYFIKFLEVLKSYKSLDNADIFKLLNDIFEEVGE